MSTQDGPGQETLDEVIGLLIIAQDRTDDALIRDAIAATIAILSEY